jgi:hypothetical protein
MLGLFRSAVARPSWRAVTFVSRALVLAATVAACRTDEPTSPARLLPADADRGVSTAATWTWLSRSTIAGTEGELTAINDRGWVGGEDLCSHFRDAASLSGGGFTYTPLDSVVWAYFGGSSLTRCGTYNARVRQINRSGAVLMGDIPARWDASPRADVVVARDNSVTQLTVGVPFAMNDSGLVGGTKSMALFYNWSRLGRSGRAVLWRAGREIDVTPAGFTGGIVMGIDSTGTIYGGRVYYVLSVAPTGDRELFVCGWLHRRGVNLYRNCVVSQAESAPPQYGGVTAINGRGDAIGSLYTQLTGSFTTGQSFYWPAAAANPLLEPTIRRWRAISHKGRLIGTQGSRLVTRSPSGTIEIITDHSDATSFPSAINSCGIVVGKWYDPVARKDIMSRWIPSVCD